jgi:hypothetical protein
VVDFVGNMEMPRWSNENKESVEAHAIELRHQLGRHMQHRVKHPPSSVEHIRHEAPSPAKDPNAEYLEYPEEALTPEERTSNTLEIDETAGMAAEIEEISKQVSMDTANNGTSDEESEAEPMDVEDDAVYAKRHDDDMEISGPDKVQSKKMANAGWEHLGGPSKAKGSRENFVRDTTETYEKAKRLDYV